jgi:hypothetical protein
MPQIVQRVSAISQALHPHRIVRDARYLALHLTARSVIHVISPLLSLRFSAWDIFVCLRCTVRLILRCIAGRRQYR